MKFTSKYKEHLKIIIKQKYDNLIFYHKIAHKKKKNTKIGFIKW